MQDYLKTYKSFINSHYFAEGLRMTVGTLLPAFILNYFHLLSVGIILSVGALFVSLTDNPGPEHHRRNGMLAAIAAVALMSLLTGFAVKVPVVLGGFIVLCTFCFSMLAVFGARPGAVGLAALIVMVINLQPHNYTAWQIITHSLYMAAGGVWYMCYSLLLYNFRPYQLPKQALGDYLQSIAEYLRIRANFYKINTDHEENYNLLMLQQVAVHARQELVNDLLFKTRNIVKETTNTGRVLVMMYFDIADVYERILTSYQQYSLLHKYFDESGILDDYFQLANDIADELENISLAIQSGHASTPQNALLVHLGKTTEKVDNLRKTILEPANIEGFISLRRILENIEDLANRLEVLHAYTTYDEKIKRRYKRELDYEKFITHQEISFQLLSDNLTLKSDNFRHSMRVSIAVLVGYLVSIFFPLGHSYWILLTIIVIIKPAYSLTQKRNRDRLVGTVAGVLAGILILIWVDNETALLVIMIILMACQFITMRKNYLASVLFMTPYIIIFFHLMNPEQFKNLFKDRIIDTIIGSVIAFAASIILFPAWEKEKINTLMIDMLEEARQYFIAIAKGFTSEQSNTSKQHITRKNALVALANLSDAFNRMLSEPKRFQQNTQHLHQFVVLNYMLTSYTASLLHYLQLQPRHTSVDEFVKVFREIDDQFKQALATLQHQRVDETAAHPVTLQILNERSNTLLQQRKLELQQGRFETSTRKTLLDLKSMVDQLNLVYKVVVDINKISGKLVSEV